MRVAVNLVARSPLCPVLYVLSLLSTVSCYLPLFKFFTLGNYNLIILPLSLSSFQTLLYTLPCSLSDSLSLFCQLSSRFCLMVLSYSIVKVFISYLHTHISVIYSLVVFQLPRGMLKLSNANIDFYIFAIFYVHSLRVNIF